MQKKITFKDYCFNTEPLVANTLLGILHLITQIIVVIGILIGGIGIMTSGGINIFFGILTILVGIPLASIFTRFRFEMIGVLFSIDKKLGNLKK